MTPSPTKSDAADDNKENSNQQVTNKDERTLTPAKKEEVVVNEQPEGEDDPMKDSKIDSLKRAGATLTETPVIQKKIKEEEDYAAIAAIHHQMALESVKWVTETGSQQATSKKLDDLQRKLEDMEKAIQKREHIVTDISIDMAKLQGNSNSNNAQLMEKIKEGISTARSAWSCSRDNQKKTEDMAKDLREMKTSITSLETDTAEIRRILLNQIASEACRPPLLSQEDIQHTVHAKYSNRKQSFHRVHSATATTIRPRSVPQQAPGPKDATSSSSPANAGSVWKMFTKEWSVHRKKRSVRSAESIISWTPSIHKHSITHRFAMVKQEPEQHKLRAAEATTPVVVAVPTTPPEETSKGVAVDAEEAAHKYPTGYKDHKMALSQC
uniref:Uncharacterized protein n=1 Tax=Caenorhabditis japonica TaxID=281687 RepID=A0A8R1IQ98_CAEJA